MKVIYLVSCFSTGAGGHYYSMLTTSESLMGKDALKVSIGTSSPQALFGVSGHINYSTKLPSISTFFKLIKLIKENNITVVHAFDNISFFYARLASFFTNTGIVLTKCGGPNPRLYYPYAKNLIVFSKEDYDYFKNNQKYCAADVKLIPNRVNITPQDDQSIRLLVDKCNIQQNTFTFVRIARFSESHKKSIEVSINLVEKLKNDGFKVKLIIIGAVVDISIYDHFKTVYGDIVDFVIEKDFTKNASRLLCSADIVIATGRGVMEAAILGIPVLVPCNNLSIPVLANKNNIDSMSRYNFSPRYTLNSVNENKIYDEICDLLKSNSVYTEHSSYIKNYANENFNIASVSDIYSTIYKSSMKAKLKPWDIVLNFLSLLHAHILYLAKNKR